MSDLPFRVWDVLQEVINCDELPDGCDVRMRAFYENGHSAFVFGNDDEMLVDVVRKKMEGYLGSMVRSELIERTLNCYL